MLRREVKNDDNATTFQQRRLADLAKDQDRDELLLQSTKTTLLALAFVQGMASPAIACIGVIGKYVIVLYARELCGQLTKRCVG
jgi:hypothetical protein